MRQSKGNPRRAYKRVIVAVLLLVALGSHAGMAHDAADVLWQAEAHQVGRPWAFIHSQVSVAVVSDACRVCSPCLVGGGQCGDQAALLRGSQTTSIIMNSKQAAHLYFPLSFYGLIDIEISFLQVLNQLRLFDTADEAAPRKVPQLAVGQMNCHVADVIDHLQCGEECA